MNDSLKGLADDYTAALRAYVARPSEADLQRAYEMGRTIIESDLGILDLVSIHHEALVKLLLAALESEIAPMAKLAEAFFAECLAPVEMTLRGFRDANATLHFLNQTLQALNQELERRVAERTDALEQANATLEAEISERKRAEEAVRNLNAGLEVRIQERTAQLEAANKELEAFSYSVSHDLRAPLRAIDGFSRMLVRDYQSNLPEQAQLRLQTIRENAQQMGALIDDLLAFARLSHQGLNKQLVAPADLVRKILAGLAGEMENRHVAVEIADLPPCQADPALLQQVWVNLLTNALKYTRQRDMARIEVGSLDLDGQQTFFIKDNGVGFDMRYYDKLFGIFQRLHRAEDFEGTGVGLATVQRIIRRHGGRVWAEAAVDQGATFYFTLERGEGSDERE
jgi:light-regulated signal transduction histidine kinase (bacteriophytochrome)